MSEMSSSFEKSIFPQKNKSLLRIIDVSILLVALFTLIYAYSLNTYKDLKIIVSIFLVLIAGYMFSIYKAKERNEPINNTITKLVLLNENGESVKEWVINEETSFLIGKQTPNIDVDIDLSDTEYASLINYEHAVLNRVLDNWYIEDIDSIYSIGIKRANKHSKSKLDPGRPCQIFAGDTIYIANAMILVK